MGKILSVSGIVVLICILLFGIFTYISRAYFKTFTLSESEVLVLLANNQPLCKKIIDCKLHPGDILLRRYITSRTWLFNKLADPYFTHSALYIGDGLLVEAQGKEHDRKDDIKVTELAKSDWSDTGIEMLVIIRPTYSASQLKDVKNNLISIANDEEYLFGFPERGKKRATCADIVFKQLHDEKIISTPDTLDAPEIITPDYLFWVTVHHPESFKIM